MPEISRFFGIIIAIFYNEHNPPHFHAKYGDFEVLLRIDNGEILAGELPRRALNLVEAWRLLHVSELQANWYLAAEHKPLRNIEPLE